MVVAKESECTDEGISRNSSSMMKGALSSPKKRHTRHMNRLKNMTLDSAMNIIHFQGRKGHCVARARSRWGIGVFLKDSQRLGPLLATRAQAKNSITFSHTLLTLLKILITHLLLNKHNTMSLFRRPPSQEHQNRAVAAGHEICNASVLGVIYDIFVI